jgi:RNA polymerase sigma-70 factor (ECF subfamily)
MKHAVDDPMFFVEHQDFVRGLARSLVFDDASADDIAQDVWLLALRHPPEEVRSIRAWLATIVRRVALRAVLRGDARRERERHTARAEAIPSADEILAREAIRRDVIEAVLALEEPYRSTMILRWFEGLEPRAIAQRTNVNRETVHTRIARAHAMLRARLDREHGSRATWAVAFACGLKLQPSVTTSLALAAKSVLPAGVWLMSGKKLALTSIALLLLAALCVWRFELGPSRTVESVSTASVVPQVPAAPLKSPEQSIEASQRSNDERAAVATRPAQSAATPLKEEGSLHLKITWSDKSAAAGVGVRAFAWQGADPYHNTFVAVSDSEGSIRLEHVAAGFVSVNLDRNYGEPCIAQILAGQETEKSIEIPRGLDVKGRVVDASSRAVADADVFMNGFAMGEGFEGFIVARSGPDGSFVARDVATWTCFSARAPMRTPTIQHRIVGAAGQSIEITLAFESPGGEISGRVLGPDHRPIAFVQVLVGPDQRSIGEQFVLADGTLCLKPASQLAITNAQGEFRFAGVELGTWPLQVRAQGFAPIKTEVVIEAKRAIHRDLDLVRACIVRGSVHDLRGAPVEKAQVQVQPSGFASPLAITKASGEFTLGNLPVGAFKLVAERDQLGRAEQTFIGEAGAELHADFVLSTGNALRGRIVAPAQQVGGWTVDVQGIDGPVVYQDMTLTDAEGRFTFVNCPDVPLRVEVRKSGVFEIARVENVRPGPQELLIEPDPTLMPSIKIRGRVVDESGHPLAAEIGQSNPRFNGGTIVRNDAESGRFEIGPFAPGEWRLRICAPGLACGTLGPNRVEPDGVWDVGDVVLKRGASLTVRLSRKDGRELTVPRMSIRTTDGHAFRIDGTGDRAVSEPLNAGHYSLHFEGDGEGHTSPDTIAFDMNDAEPQELQVVLHEGRRVTFEMRGATIPESDVIELEVVKGTGEAVATLRVPANAPAEKRVVWLSVGHYAFSAHASTKTSHGEFDIASAAESVAVDFE